MVNGCFCFNRPLAAVVHQLQDLACAASAVTARCGVVVPHRVLPAGFTTPEMPQAHLCPREGPEILGHFSLGIGGSHFTCSCSGVCLWADGWTRECGLVLL